MDCSTPGFPVLHYLPGVCTNSRALSWWYYLTIFPCSTPLLLQYLTSIFPSIFSHEFLFTLGGQSIGDSPSASNKYSGLASFRIDWFDLLAVQGTLNCLLQHYNSKLSVLRRSVFFMMQLSQTYMTTGKIIVLTIRTFVGKVMSLLFNILSRFVIAFLPRNKCF